MTIDLTEITEIRMQNLVIANDVRRARSVDKKAIGAGELSASMILRDPPVHWYSAKVVELLTSVPNVGPVKAKRWCQMGHIFPLTLLQDLRMPQAYMLASILDTRELNRR